MDLFSFRLECTRTNYGLEKIKNMLTMSSYKKMISHDLNFLQKFISFVHAFFPGLRPPRGTTEEKNTWSERIDDLQCAVNLLFLMKQLKIYDLINRTESGLINLRHQKCILV